MTYSLLLEEARTDAGMTRQQIDERLASWLDRTLPVETQRERWGATPDAIAGTRQLEQLAAKLTPGTLARG